METNQESAALIQEIEDALQRNRIWILATSAENRVSARSMSIINQGLELWFEMLASDLKGQQITANPRVALAWNNIQIEGRAEIRGNAFASGNEWFCAEYARVHPGSFERWANWPGEVVVRVVPSLITVWKYIDGQPCRDILKPSDSGDWSAERQGYFR